MERLSRLPGQSRLLRTNDSQILIITTRTVTPENAIAQGIALEFGNIFIECL
jgi:hypothetical protein